jgi:hypothetical protein
VRFTLTIDCNNAAFDDDPASEIARILRQAARDTESKGLCDGDTFHFRDINGNTVGKAQYDSEP